MACGVALKRSLELDPHHSPETVKRSRSGVFYSPLHHHHPTPQCSPSSNMTLGMGVTHFAHSSTTTTSNGVTVTPSPFAHVHGNSLSQDQLESYIQSEIGRLRRRKLLPRRRLPKPTSDQQDENMRGADSPNSAHGSGSDSDDGEMTTKNQKVSVDGTPLYPLPGSNARGEPARFVMAHQPLFSYAQVRMICNRLLNEQEAKLREEYERALSEKLNEQYEMFVQFAQDQVHRDGQSTSAAVSYLS